MKKTKKSLLRREIERVASRGKLALCTLAADLDEFRCFEDLEVMSVHGLLQLARGPRNSDRRQQQKLGPGGWRGGRQWVVVVVTELSNKLSVFPPLCVFFFFLSWFFLFLLPVSFGSPPFCTSSLLFSFVFFFFFLLLSFVFLLLPTVGSYSPSPGTPLAPSDKKGQGFFFFLIKKN